MNGAHKHTVTGLLVLGLAIVVHPEPVVAAAGDGALSGPVVAIAKARAAADKAKHRAVQIDDQGATVLGEGSTQETKSKPDPAGPTTVGSVAGKDAPPDAVGGEAAANPAEASHRTYDVAAHRDPFRPPRLNGTVDARTPLETYQLGQLKLVGVITQPLEGYRAMVEDSAGLGYIITTGTPIGSSGGVVRSIEPRRVVIEESARDFYGDFKPKEVVMELPQEDRSP